MQSIVLKIFICPSHIANWSLGLQESMGHDRHPIRALREFPLPIIDIWSNKHDPIWKWTTRKTIFRHNSYIRVYGKYLQDESKEIKRWSIYWGMLPSIGNTWAPLLNPSKSKPIDRLRHGSLHYSGQKQSKGVNRNKRNRYKSLILETIN